MRVLSTLCLIAFVATVCVAELPKGWSDLFQAPYDTTPSIMMAISCVSKDACFIPGGSNGVGFDVFNFDGQPNGNFTGLLMPHFELMIMAIGAGGTATNPKGAAGGIGFGNAVQYFANSTTLLPSVQPFLVVTQDIRASKDGSKVLVVDQGSNSIPQVLWSSDSGKSFVTKNITSLMPSQATFPRYGAIASDSTWYITLGNWPSGGSSSSGGGASKKSKREHQLSQRTTIKLSEDGKITRTSKYVENVEPTGYTCVIAKTLDAGKTWHNVMYEATNYYPNGIDCVSDKHCIAVGEGFNEKAGAHIWVTVDGLTFLQALHMKDTAAGQYSFMSVVFVNEKEAWVGGSLQSQTGSEGIMFSTKDGGLSWTEHREMNFLGEITSISFAADGYGFATAVTQFDSSTVLRYDPSGPPRTPAPVWNGNFTQISCSDNNCAVNCTTYSFPQNVCLGLNGGGSATAQCKDGILMQTVYPLSNTCTGLNEIQPQPTGECIQASNGGSFENFCGPPPKMPEGVTERMIFVGETLMRKQ